MTQPSLTAVGAPADADPAAALAGSARLSRAEKRALKRSSPEYVSLPVKLGWSARALSMAANFMILGYFTLYATDTLGLGAGLIGSLLLFSKIFDGVTDLLAGYLIDITRTRWGRARPYEFMMIGVWLCTWLLFSTPAGWSTGAKAAWVFVMYSLVNSIFATFTNINQTLYTALAFPSRVAMSKVKAFQGIVVSFGAIVISVSVPQFLQWAGKDAGRWSTFALGFALVMGVLGMLRFLLVKEVVADAEATMERVTFREIGAMLKDNRYLWLLLFVGIVGTVAGNLGAASYYYRYVVGNLGLQSVTAAMTIVLVPAVLAVPPLMKRFRLTTIMAAGQVLVAVGSIIYFFAHGNLVILIIGGIFAGLGAMPVSYMIVIVLVDCSTYNEYLGHRRMESIVGAVQSFTTKLGAGVGLGLAGWVLGAAGYDGTAATQSPAAMAAITALFSWIPAVFALMCAIGYWFFKLEDRLPQMKAEIAARQETRHAAAEAASGADGAASRS